MTVNDQLVRAYLDSERMEKYRDEWLFHALETGKNVFEYPAQSVQMAKNVEMLWRAFEEAVRDFQPATAKESRSVPVSLTKSAVPGRI